jgi:hypothetical protein
MVISGVAKRAGERLRQLVYLDAFLPGDGKSARDYAAGAALDELARAKGDVRARLTTWYSGVVVLVLLTGTLVIDIRQEHVMLQRLDDELGRLMFTLQGVMRTEFGEGLSLEASADEASIEVIAPDRTLMLTRPDGRLLERWGPQIDPTWRPSLTARP